MKQIGVFGLTIAREFGGLGLSLLEYLRVVEEIAPADASPRLLQAKRFFAYALSEPQIGSDAPQTTGGERRWNALTVWCSTVFPQKRRGHRRSASGFRARSALHSGYSACRNDECTPPWS